ncbi:MAG: HEAT repeat domain-containing protein [Planctomycetota bacterium]
MKWCFAVLVCVLPVILGCEEVKTSPNRENVPATASPTAKDSPPPEKTGKNASEAERLALEWAEQLDSPDAQVRGLAALSLLRCNDPKAKEILKRALLKKTSPEKQIAALKAYGFDRDPSMIGVMESALADKNPQVAAAASWALANIGSPAAVKALCGFLGRDDHPESGRIAIASALGQTHSKRAVESLIACLDSKSAKLREAALNSLIEITQNPSVGETKKAWEDWWAENRARSREEWLEDGIRSRDLIADILRKETGEVRAQLAEQTIRALENRPNKKDPKPLLAALRDPSTKVRLYAVTEMIKIETPDRVPALIAALSDSDAEVKQAAAVGLGDIGDKTASAPIIKTLRDPSGTVRSAAASSLGRLGCKEGVQPLITALSDPDVEVASAAASALGEIGDKAAVDPLIRTFVNGKDRTKVRESAAASLGKLGDPRAVKTLIPVLRDKDERARWFAALALGQLKAAEAVVPLGNVLSQDPSANVRLSAATSLGMIGNREAEPSLTVALDDKDPKVAAQAAEALLIVAGSDFDALLRIGRLFYEKIDDGRAGKALSQLVTKYESDSARIVPVRAARRMLASSLVRLGQWDTARQHYATLCEQDPNDAALLKEYVTCLVNDGDYPTAIRKSAEAAKLDPTKAGEWWSRIADVIEKHHKEIDQAGLDKLIAELEAADLALGGEQIKGRILKFRTPQKPATQDAEKKEGQ